MDSKEINELGTLINRLQTEGENYRATNKRLLKVCQEIEKVILESTPEDFTYTDTKNDFEIVRFKWYDNGTYRDFRYIKYLGSPITEVKFNDINLGTLKGDREQRKEFLKNLNVILNDLSTTLNKNNIDADTLMSRVKVVQP